jgi:superfamily II DNA or RNA helicase
MGLRDYQTAAIAAVRQEWESGNRETLLVAATGAGKTQMFLSLLMHDLDADPTARALIIAHRRELIEQPLDRIRLMDAGWLMNGPALDRPRVGMITQGHSDIDRQLTVATVQSLREHRIQQLLQNGRITHLVTDEAHHVQAATYQKVRRTLLDINPYLYHLGVTATPLRADGDGLSGTYASVAKVISIADLVREGWLVQPRWLAILNGVSLRDVHTRNGDYATGELANTIETPAYRNLVIQSYQKYGAGRRFIAFTISVQGAHDLAAQMRAAGMRVEAIDGTTDIVERARLLAAFRNGDLDGLTNCQVLTEGFDAPGTSCILMCRPTQSDGLYIQCMGRGLRPANGRAEPGEDCLILDFVPRDARNIVLAGDVLGIPQEQAKAIKEMVKEEAEDGAVQAGFTFDGIQIDASGTPLEIIARELNYLQASRLAWFPPRGVRNSGDVLTAAIGRGADGIDRILAIRDNVLYGIARRQTGVDDAGRPRYDNWRAYRLECDDPHVRAEEIAQKHGDPTLMRRDRGWRAGLISEGQIKFLSKLSRSRLKLHEIRLLSRGEAAQWIARFQALDALGGQ